METCLTPDQSQLAADHFYLVNDVTTRFVKRYRYHDPEELESACTEELMSCVTDGKFDESTGCFDNYATVRMWQRCLNIRSTEARQKKLLEKMPRGDVAYEDGHESREIREVCSKLSYDHVDLLIDYYWLGKSVKDIARATGSYHNAVMTKLNSALSKLRSYYGVAFA